MRLLPSRKARRTINRSRVKFKYRQPCSSSLTNAHKGDSLPPLPRSPSAVDSDMSVARGV